MRAIGLSLLLLATVPACQATHEQIETWKGTQKGPGKLREVVQDGSADPGLRALAYAALVEIGMGGDAQKDFATATPAHKSQIAHAAIDPLTQLLGKSVGDAGPTTPVQRAAKDALFELRADASEADRTQIDQVLLKWTTADLSARATLGGESSEKILRAIGPAAVPALLPLVKGGPDLILAARLVGELGDGAAKKAATAPLIELARRGPGGTKSVPEPVLHALGLVGGPEATAFLLQLANEAGSDTRSKALYALAQGKLSGGDDKALDGALAIASDPKAPGQVREAAFGVAEKLGPAAVGGLVKLLADHDETVRWRAVEAAVKAGGAEGIGRVLPNLPEDRPIKSEDLDSYVVHDLGLLGKTAVPQLLAAAKTGPALGRIAAIRAVARVGGSTDAGAMEALSSDAATSKALTPSTTVGAEAAKAKTVLSKK
jgi:HEAT repeat protein